VSDLEYEKLAARFSDDGVYGTPADPAVVTPGVGLNVNIRANVHASLRGHAWTSGTEGDSLPIEPNLSGQTRIDRVVLRLTRSTWTVRAVVKQGTPGGGVPPLSQSDDDTGTYEIAVAEVNVISGANSVTVTRKELYVGTRRRVCTSTTRNPIPVAGETCYETDTGIIRLWTGSGWMTVFGDDGIVNANAPLSAWTIQVDNIIERRNGGIHCRFGSMARAAGTLSPATESRLPILIPAAYRHPTRDQYGLGMVNGEVARYIVYSAASDRPGQVWLVNKPQISTGNILLPSGLSWVV